MALPDPDRVSITDCANWLYVSANPDTEEGHGTEHFAAGEEFASDHVDATEEEEEEPQEQFVPPTSRAYPTGGRILFLVH